MSVVLLFTFAFAAIGELPPPPAPLDAPAVPDAPIGEAPPPSPIEEPVRPPASRMPPADGPGGPGGPGNPKARAPASDDGLDPFAIGFLQWVVPCGTAIVVVPCSFVAGYVCPPALLCLPCVLPGANAFLAAYLGDRFGKERAPAIWPVIASYATTAAFGVAVVGFYVLVLPPPLGLGATEPALLFAGLGALGLVGLAGTFAVPVAYALTAEPKRFDDDGTALPGWFEPGHPVPSKKKPSREPPDAPPRLTAMRF